MCVRVNTTPDIGNYYNVNKDLSDKKVENAIVTDPNKMGLV
jgi:hypothetical protein